MDRHIKEYYGQFSDSGPHGNFHEVIALHEDPKRKWESVRAIVPDFCRGWYELAHLSPKDRVEFTRDYWMSKLPYRVGLAESINRFFASLDDIGIFVVQKKIEAPYSTHLVYSLKDNGGFFRGALPLSDKNISYLQKAFSKYIIPQDYVAFLQIHDGFSKTTDCTGIISSVDMSEAYAKLQMLMQMQRDPIVTSIGTTVDPATLIPFYESFGMPFFQCFWGEWYPEQEMGNVYYSGESNTISDIYGSGISSESMAFVSFLDWLMFYLERIE